MLPVHLVIDATLQKMQEQAIFYYIHQRGEKNSGTILLKISDRKGICKMLTQQRNFEGAMTWINAMNADRVHEKDCDEYIRRAIARDPDLWVIEIEDPAMGNPFKDIF